MTAEARIAHASLAGFNTLAAMIIGDDFGRPATEDQARRMAIAMVSAHATGGLVVFVLLGFVMPVPEEVRDDCARVARVLTLGVATGRSSVPPTTTETRR